MFRALTLATFFVLTATAAQAASSTEVPFGDLNLSRAEDAKILADRLRAAATMVCLDNNRAPEAKIMLQNCVDAAVKAATVQIEERIEQHMLSGVRANLVGVRQRVADAGAFER